MRLFALVFILQLLCAVSWASGGSSNQCVFAERDTTLQPFVQQLTGACRALVKLCEAAPTHKFCLPLTDADFSEPPASEHVRLQTVYEGWLSKIIYDWFDEEFQQAKIDKYLAKGKLLDEESRNPDLVRVTMITHLVAGGTLAWMEFFGDPTRTENLYGESQQAERREQNAKISETQNAAAAAGWVITAAAVAAARSPRIGGFLMRHASHLIMRFRQAVPLLPAARFTLPAFMRNGVAAEVAVQANNGITPGSWSIAAGAYIVQKLGFVPPSPAHMVRFDYLIDPSMVTADMEAAWAVLDGELIGDVTGVASGFGLQLVAGDLGMRFGPRASSPLFRTILTNSTETFKEIAKKQQWALKQAEWAAKNPFLTKMGFELTNNGKSILNFGRVAKTAGTAGVKAAAASRKTLDFFKLTPASLGIGVGANYAIDEATKQVQLHKLEKRMAVATDETITPILNELYFVTVKSSPSIREMFAFTRLLKEAHKIDAQKPNGPRLALLHGQMSQYLDEKNHPDFTGAHFIQKAICRTLAVLPAPDEVEKLTKEQKDQIYFLERQNMGGFSWQFIDYINRELYLYETGLKEYRGYLVKARMKYPKMVSWIDDRIQATDRWIRDAGTFIEDYDLHTERWNSSIKQYLVPNLHAKTIEKIEGAVRQIVLIEWLQQDEIYLSHFRCRAALPSSEN